MPQLTQLPDVFWSQLFWLAVVFGAIFFAIGRGMVPKIQSTVDLREKRIADDLGAADSARQQADTIEEAYRARMDASRADSAKLTAKAKAESAAATETKLSELDSALDVRIGEAQARIRDARSAAVKDIESMAADLTKYIASKVAGLTVTDAQTKAAVKTVMSDV